MSTQILPAIDILAGQVVRLRQGRFDQVTVYNSDPVDQAKQFEAAGAEIIHVVDLDGALVGHPVNYDVVARIAAAVKIPIQVGGGIRSERSLERLFDAGATRAVLGTALIKDPDLVKRACTRWPGIVAGIDAKDGRVAIEGWKQGTGVDVTEIVEALASLGVRRLVYTDIALDGMQGGPNIHAYERLVASTAAKVIASGGVTTIEDVRALAAINGVEGIIAGRSLYEGTLDLTEAIAVARGEA